MAFLKLRVKTITRFELKGRRRILFADLLAASEALPFCVGRSASTSSFAARSFCFAGSSVRVACTSFSPPLRAHRLPIFLHLCLLSQRRVYGPSLDSVPSVYHPRTGLLCSRSTEKRGCETNLLAPQSPATCMPGSSASRILCPPARSSIDWIEELSFGKTVCLGGSFCAPIGMAIITYRRTKLF